MEERVLQLIAEALDVSPDTIERDRLLVEYGLDSARALDLVVALEEAFGLSISDDAARDMRSVNDILRFVASQVQP